MAVPKKTRHVEIVEDGGRTHETGLDPDVDGELTEIEFGSEPPAGDATLQKVLDHIASKK